MPDFAILNKRDIRAVHRGLARIKSGLELLAVIAAKSVVVGAIRKMKRRKVRKTRTVRKMKAK